MAKLTTDAEEIYPLLAMLPEVIVTLIRHVVVFKTALMKLCA